jgi:hypothetical protein
VTAAEFHQSDVFFRMTVNPVYQLSGQFRLAKFVDVFHAKYP